MYNEPLVFLDVKPALVLHPRCLPLFPMLINNAQVSLKCKNEKNLEMHSRVVFFPVFNIKTNIFVA